MDPNKYAKNANIKANSPLKTIQSIATFALILLGLAGLAHDLFKEDGWIKGLFSTIFDSTSGLLIIPVIVGVAWAFNRWTTSPNKDQRSKAGDIPLYIIMVVGAYYLFKLVTTGSL